MTQRRILPLVLGLLALGLVPACQQQMADQPRYDPLEPSDFFIDGRSARPLEPDTVARGHLRDDTHLYTGRRAGATDAGQAAALFGAAANPNVFGVIAAGRAEARFVDTFPFPVTRDVLLRGRQRYTIYCALCHGPLGHGDGKIVERGFTKPPAFYLPRLQQAPVGYVFDVITNGYGAMPDYAGQIDPQDRWAIVAYVRVLQRSHVTYDELSEKQRIMLPSKETKPDGRGGR